MSNRELHRAEIIQKLIDKRLLELEAAEQLALAYIRKNYSDFKPTFACEKSSENHSLMGSHETLRKWMIEAELWIPRSKRLLQIDKHLI